MSVLKKCTDVMNTSFVIVHITDIWYVSTLTWRNWNRSATFPRSFPWRWSVPSSQQEPSRRPSTPVETSWLKYNRYVVRIPQGSYLIGTRLQSNHNRALQSSFAFEFLVSCSMLRLTSFGDPKWSLKHPLRASRGSLQDLTALIFIDIKNNNNKKILTNPRGVCQKIWKTPENHPAVFTFPQDL